MKKIIISVVAAISLLFGGIAIGDSLNGSFNGNPIAKVVSDGKVITDEVPAQVIDGKTLVPLTMLRQFGFDVTWDQSSYSANVIQNKTSANQIIKNVLKNGGSNLRFESDSKGLVVLTDYQMHNGLNNDWNDINYIFVNMSQLNADFMKLNYFANGRLYETISIDFKTFDDYLNHRISDKELADKWLVTIADNQTTVQNNDQRSKLTAKDIAKLTDRVATIVTYDALGKPISQGSGFIIDRYGTLVTNSHVMQNAYSWEITLNGSTYHHHWYLFNNPKTDVFGLYASCDPLTGQISSENNFPFLPYNTKLPEVGDKVYAIGSPKGLTNTVSEGIVSGVRTVDGMMYIQHTASITHGSSGGALFNENGEVIGITNGGIDGTGIEFAIPVIFVQQEINNLMSKK